MKKKSGGKKRRSKRRTRPCQKGKECWGQPRPAKNHDPKKKKKLTKGCFGGSVGRGGPGEKEKVVPGRNGTIRNRQKDGGGGAIGEQRTSLERGGRKGGKPIEGQKNVKLIELNLAVRRRSQVNGQRGGQEKRTAFRQKKGSRPDGRNMTGIQPYPGGAPRKRADRARGLSSLCETGPGR